MEHNHNSVYPLDPLTTNEIEAAVEIIREEQSLSRNTFFPRIALHEPTKSQLKRYDSNNTRINREAFVTVFDARANTTGV